MSSDLQLPAGFRFHPTDEELVIHYLCRKCASQSIAVPIIADIDLYKYDPWQLPEMALYGEKEWYFFSPRNRKYPNGSRPNRMAGKGYWKATGTDKPIGKPKAIAIKKALVFYTGKAPKGKKSDWIMHEYRLAGVDRSAGKKNRSDWRLDDWVLCRIYKKKSCKEKEFAVNRYSFPSTSENWSEIDEKKPELLIQRLPPAGNDAVYYETSDSVPKLHVEESSCSEHVLSTELTCDMEAQSLPSWREWENALNFPINDINATTTSVSPFSHYDDDFQNQNLNQNQFSPFDDMFMYLQKPF